MAPRLILPSPIELGFPDKFDRWRDAQLNAIDQFMRSDKRAVGLVMPTGSGKSLTYVAATLLKQGVKRGLILTSTKGLQDQVAKDFRPLGLVDVRGQRNYACTALDPGGELDQYARVSRAGLHACDDGPCHMGVKCASRPDRNAPLVRPDCLYYGAVFDARRAPLVITNYTYWMSIAAYGGGLGDFEMIVLDEAHNAEKELEGFLGFQVTEDDAIDVQSSLLTSNDLRDWVNWAAALSAPLKDWIDSQDAPETPSALRHLQKLQRVSQKLEMLSGLELDEWVLERFPRSMAFSPIRTARYAERYLFRNIPKILLTSATLTHKTLSLLGIARDQYRLWESPSDFPVERRPVIHTATLPRVTVDHRMTDAHKLMWRRRIDRIIAPRLGEKGIIHTVSYARMKELLTLSEFKAHMIGHDTGSTQTAVQRFKSAKAPAILVSPSMTTGWDFPDDECRWQIIGKLPLPDTRGATMVVRKELDPDYIPYLTAQQIVQATGRGMRSAEDWCETFIVDDHIEWFIRKHRRLFPAWFMQSFESTSTLPPPLVL